MNTEKKTLESRRACIISITRAGNDLAQRISESVEAEEKIDLYTLEKYGRDGFKPVVSLDDFFAESFKTYDTIIAVMATGIVIRKIAPLLVSKVDDPGIIVTDVMGENYISLLSGHLGRANENARILAKTMKKRAIITTASDNLNLPAVDTIAKEVGARIKSLANAKEITSLIVDKKRVALIGFDDYEIDCKNLIKLPYPPDLFNIDEKYSNLDNILPKLKEEFDGIIILSDRERLVEFPIPSVQLIPVTTTIGIGFKKETTADQIVERVVSTLDIININKKSLKTIATIKLKAEERALKEAAEELGTTITVISTEDIKRVEDRFLGSEFVENTVGVRSVSEPCGYLASNRGECIFAEREQGIVISVWREGERKVEPKKIYVTGIGPGDMKMMSESAKNSLLGADVIVGYKTYIDLIKNSPELKDKEFLSTGMQSEAKRAETVLELADKGMNVTLISSGDPGVYGMAGILLELAENSDNVYDIEVIPGITAANAAAAVLGAPLMNDYCVISLSDILTPWDSIEKSLNAAAEGDFVTVLYNPKSLKRTEQIVKAREIFLKYRSPDTPVGIVTNLSRDGESIIITNLEMMLESDINMFSTVIIGNSNSYISKSGTKIITPRGYDL